MQVPCGLSHQAVTPIRLIQTIRSRNKFGWAPEKFTIQGLQGVMMALQIRVPPQPHPGVTMGRRDKTVDRCQRHRIHPNRGARNPTWHRQRCNDTMPQLRKFHITSAISWAQSILFLNVIITHPACALRTNAGNACTAAAAPLCGCRHWWLTGGRHKDVLAREGARSQVILCLHVSCCKLGESPYQCLAPMGQSCDEGSRLPQTSYR
mmetsp:Transcript_54384/g.137363  ORF Transcript_54384/g.137363 Transcript_54384/m.137363 type:complete len:207 (-) Transcript_54384:70-690(-)